MNDLTSLIPSFGFTLTEPFSATITAVSNLIGKMFDAGINQYNGMTEAQKEEFNSLLLKHLKRTDDVLEALHQLAFRKLLEQGKQ